MALTSLPISGSGLIALSADEVPAVLELVDIRGSALLVRDQLLSGQLTRNVELRTRASGADVARLRVATTTRRRAGEEWVEKTNYGGSEVPRRRRRMPPSLAAGVAAARAAWRNWDVVIDNVNANNVEATLPETLPRLCSACHLPCCNPRQSRDGRWRVRDWSLEYDGRTYHFCTNACRQIFWTDRENVNHETLVDRFLDGQIQPMDVDGVLNYMAMTPEVIGDDPDYEAWTKDYVGRPASGLAAVA